MACDLSSTETKIVFTDKCGEGSNGPVTNNRGVATAT